MVDDGFTDLDERRSVAGQAALVPGAGRDAGEGLKAFSIYVFARGPALPFLLKETPETSGDGKTFLVGLRWSIGSELERIGLAIRSNSLQSWLGIPLRIALPQASQLAILRAMPARPSNNHASRRKYGGRLLILNEPIHLFQKRFIHLGKRYCPTAT